jgi:DNA-binding CsgD family transcriptional regulator
MYLEEITQLTNFISTSKRSADEICKYLIVHTFREFSPRAIYVGQLDNEGHLMLKASFGFIAGYLKQFKKLPLNINIPVIEAVRTDEIIHIDSRESFFKNYPEVTSLGTIDEDWSSAIAVPVQSIGAYFLVLRESSQIDAEVKCFLKTIAHLLALTLEETIPVYKSRVEQAGQLRELTARQEIIKSILAKGYTNAHIAKEIGYSESLVRQETIAIYSALRISGREELIKAEMKADNRA